MKLVEVARRLVVTRLYLELLGVEILLRRQRLVLASSYPL